MRLPPLVNKANACRPMSDRLKCSRLLEGSSYLYVHLKTARRKNSSCLCYWSLHPFVFSPFQYLATGVGRYRWVFLAAISH
ncbi:hypothetical protein QWZ13_08165 [Reinekea marina]|uniref:hypothetical protein n=1 Tax=Reinekea marina TaxID=1310421 RepID=UPI0025B35496|nr:hypothetical protein [Reinekea marina]MDN3648884.1 hypothetical protein [Reinekea marina]